MIQQNYIKKLTIILIILKISCIIVMTSIPYAAAKFGTNFDEVEHGKILFLDTSQLDSMSEGVSFEMHPGKRANNGNPVIYPTEEWENWATFAYNSVVQHPNGTFFMYYDCVSSDKTRNIIRFTCLATSDDGISWVKPILNLANYNNSTKNNIVWPLSSAVGIYHYIEPGTVFIDTNPKIVEDEKWKMLVRMNNQDNTETDTYVLSSHDGINWKKMFEAPSMHRSDTQNVAWYDNEIDEYVIFMRIDDLNPKEHSGPHGACQGPLPQLSADFRRIGRCTTKDLSNFECEPGGSTEAADVFTFDAIDPPCMDIYTNAATRYYNRILMFPSIFQKCVLAENEKNDGLLDIRLISSFDGGHTANYVPSDTSNARQPFVRLNLNRCDGKDLNYSSFPKDMPWCVSDTESVGKSTYGAGENYFNPGYIEVNNGEDLLLYYGGAAFTHAGDADDNQHWKSSSSGLGAIIVKRDRFASINGGYIFNKKTIPTLRTVTMKVPDCVFSIPSIRFNFETSVVGYIKLQLNDDEKAPLDGYSFNSSSTYKGNFLSMRPSWNKKTVDLLALVGERISISVEIVDARLFSIFFTCEEES